jgi:hypothetical protein
MAGVASRSDTRHPIQFVILSVAGTSRSEAPAESKDPYTLNCGKKCQGILPAQPISWSVNG